VSTARNLRMTILANGDDGAPSPGARTLIDWC
jgi:hypothetical protein